LTITRNHTLSLEDAMPIPLPESVKKVLEDKAYGHVVTFNPNGQPQLTMVWMDVDGNEALFNTAEGRKKVQNLRRDPRIMISVQNRSEPQSYVVLNGAATLTETGADAHIDKLAKRFLGLDKYPYRQPGEKRVIVRVKIDRLGGLSPKMQPWT
jgi:PPOX class probable F420-dependent enzyme